MTQSLRLKHFVIWISLYIRNKTTLWANLSRKIFFKNRKNHDDVIFPVSVSNFAGLSLAAKVETETGLGLGLEKIYRYRSRSRTSRPRLQPWFLLNKSCNIRYRTQNHLLTSDLNAIIKLVSKLCREMNSSIVSFRFFVRLYRHHHQFDLIANSKAMHT